MSWRDDYEFPGRMRAGDCAAVLGVSRQAVASAPVGRNPPEQDVGGRPTYDLRALVAWKVEQAEERGRAEGERAVQARSGGNGGSGSGGAKAGTDGEQAEFWPPLERKRLAEAYQAETALAEQLGLLVRREDVEQALYQALRNYVEELRQLPPRLAPRLQGRPAEEVAGELRAAIEQGLNGLKEDLQLAKGRAREHADEETGDETRRNG